MTDTPTPPSDNDIRPVSIEDEMRRSYLDYAMSVIVSRALPDVRDGLKPVHRRILYAMKVGGYDSGKPFRKSARIVGDVMGNYHPHGDQAIYDALVRMAQDFSMRLPLISGQGNFGSMDGDPAAAMRYTEARLAKAAEPLLDDIDKQTVNFTPTYDESGEEPSVLPARYPNLLVNGAGGIAVGMATNIPTHNLGEVIDATCALIDDPTLTIDQLMEYLPGPDFPTGGVILGRAGIRSAYHTGRGSVITRARHVIEPIGKDRSAIVVNEIPFQVNKARLVERIAEVVREKQVEGIAEMRDESDRDGVRLVMDLKRDAIPDVVLAQLYRFTPLQTSFGVNMLALNGGRPELLDLKRILEAFIAFREEVIVRRTVYELGQARARAHTLLGLAVAVANLDPVIALIRRAPDPQTAREELMATAWPAADIGPYIELVGEPDRPLHEDGTYRLSEAQAKAILDLRLHRLTGLERDKIAEDLKTIVDRISEFLEILSDRAKLLSVMRDDLVSMRDQFANPRRTGIDDVEFEADIEALIAREEMVVTVSNAGYIKRVPLSTYRAQKRGGKGRSGMATRDEDFVSDIFIANTHSPLLFFSSRGIAYKLKTYKLPIGTPQARGKALVNLLPLEQGETVTAWMALPEDEDSWGALEILFATASGGVRRNRLSDFTQINRNGKIAMKLDDGDSLIGAKICQPDQDALLVTKAGMCIRFSVEDVRVFAGRTSTGVRGIRLGQGDRVISLSILPGLAATAEERDVYLRMANQARRAEGEESDGEDSVPTDGTDLTPDRYREMEDEEVFILTISEQGFGKLSSSYAYRRTGRGGKGIWAMSMGERNKAIAACFPVEPRSEIMLATDGGQVMRCPVEDVRIAARKTQGVTVFRIPAEERVIAVAAVTEAEGAADEAAEDAAAVGEGDVAAGDATAAAVPGTDGAAAPDAGGQDESGPEDGAAADPEDR